MKKTAVVVILASAWFLAGCCTTHHTTKKWEYMVTYSTPKGAEGLKPERQQQNLNEWGKEGWILVTKDGDLFYLARPVK